MLRGVSRIVALSTRYYHVTSDLEIRFIIQSRDLLRKDSNIILTYKTTKNISAFDKRQLYVTYLYAKVHFNLSCGSWTMKFELRLPQKCLFILKRQKSFDFLLCLMYEPYDDKYGQFIATVEYV